MAPSDAQPIIRMAGVSKFFGEFQALKDVSIEVNLGERVVVCGPSGSGKSTLIRCINRLERHQQGSIAVDGVSLTVSGVDASGFEVVLIPHTLEVTVFGSREPGDEVNLEADVLAKYVERLMEERR